MTARTISLPGDGRGAVLLIHGLTGAPSEMLPVARRLARHGFAVEVPLLAGHGAGKAALLGTGWRDWMAGCEAAFDAAAARHRVVHVGGVCAGAALAVLLAARRPVASLATYSMTFRYDGWSLPAFTRAGSVIGLFTGLPGVRSIAFAERPPYGIKDDRLRARLLAQAGAADSGILDHFPFGALGQFLRMAREAGRRASAVTAPALLVHAREDDMAALSNSQRLYGLLQGPKRLEILEDSFHLVHLDRQAPQVAAMTIAHCEAANG